MKRKLYVPKGAPYEYLIKSSPLKGLLFMLEKFRWSRTKYLWYLVHQDIWADMKTRPFYSAWFNQHIINDDVQKNFLRLALSLLYMLFHHEIFHIFPGRLLSKMEGYFIKPRICCSQYKTLGENTKSFDINIFPLQRWNARIIWVSDWGSSSVQRANVHLPAYLHCS